MARMSDDELNEIIERDLPGHRVLYRKPAREEGADAPEADRPDADEASPDLDELKRKFLGDAAEDAVDTERTSGRRRSRDRRDSSDASEEGDGENADDEIVIVERRDASDPHDHRPHEKAVVVSGKDRRIVGYQG